ncbi:AI-2E family transporter [Halomonas sp. WWR20]
MDEDASTPNSNGRVAEDPTQLRHFARKVWITVGITAAVVTLLSLAWLGLEVLLMALAGLLMALFFYLPAAWLSRHSFLSHRWALGVVLLVLIGLLVLFSLNFASHLTQQSQQLVQILPSSLEALEQQVRAWPLGSQVMDQLEQGQSITGAFGNGFAHMTSIFTTTFGALINAVVILFIGLFVAFEPWTYRKGLLLLVFPRQRNTAAELLTAIVNRMSWWLLGRLVSMTVIGMLTGVGLWLLGVPMALSLGLLAAVLTFIPYLGPVLSAIPALLVAFTLGQEMLAYVAGLYLGVQMLESYLITPYIQREAVNIPPGVLIVVQIWLSLFAGALGLLMAGPLTALTMEIVKRTYVDGWLAKDTSEPTAGDN